MASDGNVSRDRPMMRITLNDKDEKILIDIKNVLKYSGNITNSIKSNSSTLAFTSKSIYEKLNKIGITPRKTYCLDIEKIISNIPKEFFGDFIRGYFDGDGSIGYIADVKTGTISRYKVTITASKDTCLILNELLGFNSKYYERTFNVEECVGFGSIQITSIEKLEIFYNLIYPPGVSLFLERKKKKFDELLINKNKKITI